MQYGRIVAYAAPFLGVATLAGKHALTWANALRLAVLSVASWRLRAQNNRSADLSYGESYAECNACCNCGATAGCR